uniref:Uncharacterized protein n=1 Tax=Chenopodium quinoa TaxID=63459 RepID=A0A803N5S1_CHEQI
MARGKSILYFDPRSGSYLVVKVVRPSIGEPAIYLGGEKGTGSQEKEHEVIDVTMEKCSTSSPNRNPSDVERKEEVHSSTEITNVSSRLSIASSNNFNFICKSKGNSRRISRCLITRKAFRQWNTGKRRRTNLSSAASNISTNMFSSCRSQIGKKRKIVTPPISDPPHYQKKSTFNASYCTCSSSFTFLRQCHELVCQSCKSTSVVSIP